VLHRQRELIRRPHTSLKRRQAPPLGLRPWGVAPRLLPLQAALECGEPLLLEVCRSLQSGAPGDVITPAVGGAFTATAGAAVGSSTAPALVDPCFGAYHALFEVEAAEQLLEPGAAAAELVARPLGAFAAVAAGRGVGASCLPPPSVPPPK
jgi:hypothetical protein